MSPRHRAIRDLLLVVVGLLFIFGLLLIGGMLDCQGGIAPC